MNNDTGRLNWLETQNKKAKFTGECVFRWSTTGRGWRLIETSREEASALCDGVIFKSVRDAIDYAMRQEQKKTYKHTDHNKSPYGAGLGSLNKTRKN